MKNQKDEILIEYILDAIVKLTQLSNEDNAKQRFFNDWMFHDALLHRLQTMTESCQKLSDEFKKSLPLIPWKEISGLRNVLLHDYLGDIDIETIWHILSHELQTLRQAIEQNKQQKKK